MGLQERGYSDFGYASLGTKIYLIGIMLETYFEFGLSLITPRRVRCLSEVQARRTLQHCGRSRSRAMEQPRNGPGSYKLL